MLNREINQEDRICKRMFGGLNFKQKLHSIKIEKLNFTQIYFIIISEGKTFVLGYKMDSNKKKTGANFRSTIATEFLHDFQFRYKAYK